MTIVRLPVSRAEATEAWTEWKRTHLAEYAELKNRPCFDCGAVSGVATLSVHHRDGNKTNNDPSNHETLCWSCHRKRHHTALKVVYLGEEPDYQVSLHLNQAEHKYLKPLADALGVSISEYVRHLIRRKMEARR